MKNGFVFQNMYKQCSIYFEELHFKCYIVPGMAVRGMRGMMGDIALSVSSSLGSRSWGNRFVSSPTLLSGDDAGMMLSGASSSSLSILLKTHFLQL